MMERLLDEITDTERIQSLAKVIAHLERRSVRLERYLSGNDHSWTDLCRHIRR
jgi:hypothetical protein